MSCAGEEHGFDEAGAIEPRICAALAGVGEERIEQWRGAGLLPGALRNQGAEPDFPDEPDWFYSWDDLHRILAAAKLIELGLPAERLAETFARFDGACRWWAVTPFTVTLEPVFPAGLSAREFVAQRWHEAELGRLHRFADVIQLDPDIHGGLPVFRGRRVDTRTIIAGHRGGMTTESLCRNYTITPYQVQRAIEFELQLEGVARIDAPAAG